MKRPTRTVTRPMRTLTYPTRTLKCPTWPIHVPALRSLCPHWPSLCPLQYARHGLSALFVALFLWPRAALPADLFGSPPFRPFSCPSDSYGGLSPYDAGSQCVPNIE